MSVTIAVIMVYGAFCLAGGLAGYLKAKSVASLITGSLAGITVMVCGEEMMQGHRAAGLVVLMIALLLFGRFLLTWRTSRRVMPDLLMIVLSAITVSAVGVSLANW